MLPLRARIIDRERPRATLGVRSAKPSGWMSVGSGIGRASAGRRGFVHQFGINAELHIRFSLESRRSRFSRALLDGAARHSLGQSVALEARRNRHPSSGRGAPATAGIVVKCSIGAGEGASRRSSPSASSSGLDNLFSNALAFAAAKARPSAA